MSGFKIRHSAETRRTHDILNALHGAAHALEVLDWLADGRKSFEGLVELRAVRWVDDTPALNGEPEEQHTDDRARHFAMRSLVHDLKALDGHIVYSNGLFGLNADAQEAIEFMRTIADAWKPVQR